jgi:hypothetical protein
MIYSTIRQWRSQEFIFSLLWGANSVNLSKNLIEIDLLSGDL